MTQDMLIESALESGEVDQVVNTGTVVVINMVTFPRVPEGSSPRIDQPDPGIGRGL